MKLKIVDAFAQIVHKIYFLYSFASVTLLMVIWPNFNTHGLSYVLMQDRATSKSFEYDRKIGLFLMSYWREEL